MRVNKQGKRALDRETYKSMQDAGIPMSSYYMEGASGGLVSEAFDLNQHPDLVEFLDKVGMNAKWTHERRDGTTFDIRISGKNND